MVFFKYTVLGSAFVISFILGLMISKKYKNRVRDLKEIRSILNILETKLKYTYEPLPVVFKEIYLKFRDNVGMIFKMAASKMDEFSAGDAWCFGVENSSTNMNKEDLEALKSLEKLLGKTNMEGQLSEIELLKKFIDTQIVKAQDDANRNEKLYKSLGAIVGSAIVIFFA